MASIKKEPGIFKLNFTIFNKNLSLVQCMIFLTKRNHQEGSKSYSYNMHRILQSIPATLILYPSIQIPVNNKS